MARDGVRTLYLQTGNYEQRTASCGRRRWVDSRRRPRRRDAGRRLVPALVPLPGAGHAAGACRDPVPQHQGRALRLLRARHRGQPRPARCRSGQAPAAALRPAAGGGRPRYPLGAIIPSPVGIRRHRVYWPAFPYRGLARYYDVFLPMATPPTPLHGSRPRARTTPPTSRSSAPERASPTSDPPDRRARRAMGAGRPPDSCEPLPTARRSATACTPSRSRGRRPGSARRAARRRPPGLHPTRC